MGNIRIERVPIQEMGLWLIRADHLMLVYQQDPLDYGEFQHRWWVMEGTRDVNADGSVTVGVDGENGVTTLSEANGGKDPQELLDAIRYPWWRGSHIIQSPDSFNDWQSMATIARDIDRQDFPYFAFNVALSPLPIANSSSVIASLLYYIGVDIAENMPSMFLTYTVGTQTLLGTTHDDELTLEWSFDTILSGGGKDTLKGTDLPTNIEKLYGGTGDDIFLWSEGNHVYHGGQPDLDYARDGLDTVDYTGIGIVRIEAPDGPVPHLRADFLALHATGTDRFYSIEAIRWDDSSDMIVLGEGVELVRAQPVLDLKGEETQGRGDTLDFSERSSGLLSAPSNRPDIVLIGSQASDGDFADGGLWARSLEWLIATPENDRIYAGPAMKGAEGGAGDDLLSGQFVAPLSGHSPLGYDVELAGGAGNDTLISGSGRTLATGGAGADSFVLSSLSEENRITEFVIGDADASDRLFVPYNFLIPEVAGFAGSLLFPILGAITPVIGGATFANLPQNPGPGPINGYDAPGFFYLASQVPIDGSFDGTWDGVVNIHDLILFNRDGDDLLIHVWAGGGEAFTQAFFNLNGQDFKFEEFDADPFTEAVIRVLDFQEGMLGINFYELGEETPFPFPGGDGTPDPQKLWNTASFMQNGDTFLRDPLQPEPETPVYNKPSEGETDERPLLSGGDGDDVLIVIAPATGYSSGSDLVGGAGNDQLTGGTGQDLLDGGTGDDVMAGGRGDDRYIVDSLADTVVELANSGFDAVVSYVNYVLPGHVEDLTLTGAATSGQGNGLNNRILGTANAEHLQGLGGDDTISGAAGDDILDGGSGNDTYTYAAGHGNDIILASEDATAFDVLQLIGFGADDVSIFLSPSGADVLLRLADGSRLALDNFFSGGSIDAVGFEDGTVWEAAFLSAAAASSGPLLNDAPVARNDDGLVTHLKEFVIPQGFLLANDTDVDGDPLTIVATRSKTRGAGVGVTDEGDVEIGVLASFTGLVAFEYLVEDGRGGETWASVNLTIMPNEAPELSGAPLANQSIDAGAAWTFAVPSGLFTDPDGHPMLYTADLADGSALPSWLSYEPLTRVFSGMAPAGASGDFTIRVTASDGVARTSTSFVLSVTGATPGMTVTGTSGADVLTGGAGKDTLIGGAGSDVLSGSGGDDLFLVSGDAGFDRYEGGDGFDTILGGSGDDIIGLSGVGNVRAASGGDAQLQASSIAMSGVPDLNLIGIEAIDGGGGFDILRLYGNANVYDFTAITLTGIELIAGGRGNDHITGSGGDDVIDGGRGADILLGGTGNDTFLFKRDQGGDVFDGGQGFDAVLGSAGDDVLQLRNGSRDLTSIEALDAGAGFDVLRLSRGDDVLDLSGMAVSGLERIEGRGGNDHLRGSSASEILAGGSGRDAFLFAGAFGHDTIADFQLGTAWRNADVIDLSAFNFASFADVLAQTRQVGESSVISIADGSSSITIDNIAKSLLTPNDFVL